MTRILIADDHDVVRAGLRTILQPQAGWEVVAEASDGKEAVELLSLPAQTSPFWILACRPSTELRRRGRSAPSFRESRS